MRLVLRDARALYGNTQANAFGPRALKAVRQVWLDRGQTRSTINKNQGRLVRVFRWAAAEEYVDGNVVHALGCVQTLKRGRTEARESKPVLPVDVERVRRTIEHLPSVTADMVRFSMLTGARPGEVCKLRPRDVDRSMDIWEYRVVGHKTEHHGRSRTVYIGPEAQKVLEPYLNRDPEVVCFSMAESLEERRQVNARKRTTPLSCGNRRGKRSNADVELNVDRKKRSPRFAFDPGTGQRLLPIAKRSSNATRKT